MDKMAAFFNLINKYYELLQVIIECGEYIDVIPGNTGYNGNVWKKKMKLGPFFYNTGRVFITFANNKRCVGYFNRLLKSLQPCSYQVVKIFSCLPKHMHNHGGCCSFPVTTTNHNSCLIPAFLVNIFGERIYRKPQLFCFQKLRVIPFCMHS